MNSASGLQTGTLSSLVFAIEKEMLLIKDTKQIWQGFPSGKLCGFLALTWPSGGSKRLFEEGGGGGLGWLHAGSQAFRVCVGALKCHLERRASGRVVEGAGAMKGVAPLAVARHGAFNITWAPVHLSTHAGYCFCLIYSESGSFSAPFMLWFNTCAGFLAGPSALKRGVSGSL